MKNTTRIGTSLLGTWSAEVQLSDHDHDGLSAYFLVHFMADPRKSHGCALAGCSEVDNQVCMMEADGEGNIHDRCHEIAKQTDVSWSDLNAFFYFGVKVDSESKPKAKFELSTGEWIGPFSILMAQDEIVPFGVNNSSMIDRYVARYVQSQSTMPVFLQNRMPLSSTLYHKPNDYATFLGHSALSFMTKSQTNYTIAVNDTTIQNDPYAPYYQNCTLGDVQPILPLIELEYFDHSNNHTSSSSNKSSDDDLEMALRLQYKIMAVPSPDERAYHVLPQLQKKFQGQGAFNIIGGPYCYQQDEQRGWSLDLTLNSQHNGTGVEFVRGCLPGLSDVPCVPPAAMGGIPIRQANHTCSHEVEPSKVFASNVVLMLVAYTLGVALLLSLMGQHWQDGPRAKRREQQQVPPTGDSEEADNNWMNFMREIGEAAKKPFAGLSDNLPLSENINPFGDLDPEEEAKEDPLQQPLLPSTDTPATEEAEAKEDEEAK